jgi:nitrate reductase delta subunit
VAAGAVESGRALLGEHRVGLELLRFALTDAGSPWRWVLESVSATLPALRGEEHAAVARLAAEGPPAEQVGLAPFAPPEYMPQPTGSAR